MTAQTAEYQYLKVGFNTKMTPAQADKAINFVKRSNSSSSLAARPPMLVTDKRGYRVQLQSNPSVATKLPQYVLKLDEHLAILDSPTPLQR